MFKYWKGTCRKGENENIGKKGVNIWTLKRWKRQDPEHTEKGLIFDGQRDISFTITGGEK